MRCKFAQHKLMVKNFELSKTVSVVSRIETSPITSAAHPPAAQATLAMPSTIRALFSFRRCPKRGVLFIQFHERVAQLQQAVLVACGAGLPENTHSAVVHLASFDS
jgi:hypothetical protein